MMAVAASPTCEAVAASGDRGEKTENAVTLRGVAPVICMTGPRVWVM